MVAEDNPTNRLVIRKVLENWGAEVSLAEDGVQAVDEFVKNEASFDFILMDCEMPELDGYGATKQIRALNKQIPIIALTAHALPEFKERALQVGMTEYATKPIDRPALLAAIRRHVWRRIAPAQDSASAG